MVGHGGSSAGSYLADPTSPIPSHCASIITTSTLRVNSSHVCNHLFRSIDLGCHVCIRGLKCPEKNIQLDDMRLLVMLHIYVSSLHVKKIMLHILFTAASYHENRKKKISMITSRKRYKVGQVVLKISRLKYPYKSRSDLLTDLEDTIMTWDLGPGTWVHINA